MANRKIVEFFIDTDSESESYTSSDGATEEVEDGGSGGIFAAEELAANSETSTEEEIEVDAYDEESLMEFNPVVQSSIPLIPQEFDADLKTNSDCDLYGRDRERSESCTPTPTDCISSVESLTPDKLVVLDSPPSYRSQQGEGMADTSCKKDISEGVGVRDKSAMAPGHCICGTSSVDSSSMIECCVCLNHFHGDCVGISRQKATMLKHFYCPLCMDNNPQLVTQFENKAERGEESERGARLCEREFEAGMMERVSRRKGMKRRMLKSRKSNRTCGACTACLNIMDCRRCRFCRDLPKYGGPGKARQKCIMRQCLYLSKILYTDGSLLTGKPVLQEEMAAELKALGLSLPSIDDPLFFLKDDDKGDGDSDGTAAEEEERIFQAPTVTSVAAIPPPLKKKPGRRGRPPGRGRRHGGKSDAKKGRRKDVEDIIKASANHSRLSKFADLSGGVGSYSREDFYTPTHCLGPGCVYESRPHSKYCSDECGIQLAMRRIRTFLPPKKELMDKEKPIATFYNAEKLKDLEKEQMSIEGCLDELDNQTDAIDDHLIKTATLTPAKEEDVFELESEDLTIHCATCSQPVTLKKAMVHMERCFNKLEGMVSFGSIVKNEGTNIFCDKYDSSQNTYCKRLRVLCPEHTKEPKIGPKEVCGCPLDPLFPATNKTCEAFCEQPRKSCIKHYCWVKLRKAEIDQQKLNLFLKMEEVGEQIRLNQWQMSHRSSLLAIMLHHTTRHTDSSSTWEGMRTVKETGVKCATGNESGETQGRGVDDEV